MNFASDNGAGVAPAILEAIAAASRVNAPAYGADAYTARAEALLAELVDCVHEAANLPECECDVDVDVARTFEAYRLTPGLPVVRAAERALRERGYEPVRVASGGASDANALIARGVPVVNLANGTERNHEPRERVAVEALERMLDVALALPEAVASVLAAPSAAVSPVAL